MLATQAGSDAPGTEAQAPEATCQYRPVLPDMAPAPSRWQVRVLPVNGPGPLRRLLVVGRSARVLTVPVAGAVLSRWSQLRS